MILFNAFGSEHNAFSRMIIRVPNVRAASNGELRRELNGSTKCDSCSSFDELPAAKKQCARWILREIKKGHESILLDCK